MKTADDAVKNCELCGHKFIKEYEARPFRQWGRPVVSKEERQGGFENAKRKRDGWGAVD